MNGDVTDAVLVLGPHRSGTSCVAEILYTAGYHLGVDLLGEHVCNERGLWENAKIVAINERILRSRRTAWYSISSHDEWMVNDFSDEELCSVGSVLLNQFGRARAQGCFARIAIKDPRLCLLAPLYEEALEVYGANPRYVITLRHPFVCAESLYRRDGLPRRHGISLWVKHMLGALEAARKADAFLVSYDDLLNRTDQTCEAFAQWLMAGCAIDQSVCLARMQSAVTPNLNHSTDQVCFYEDSRDDVASLAVSIYNALADGQPIKNKSFSVRNWLFKYKRVSEENNWFSFDRVVVVYDSLPAQLKRQAKEHCGILLIKDGQEPTHCVASDVIELQGVGLFYNLVDRGESASLVRGASLCAGKFALLMFNRVGMLQQRALDWFLGVANIEQVVRIFSSEGKLVAIAVPNEAHSYLDFWNYIEKGDESLGLMIQDCLDVIDIVL